MELTEAVEYSDAGPGLVSTSPQFKSQKCYELKICKMGQTFNL